jgi:hypothetical protein
MLIIYFCINTLISTGVYPPLFLPERAILCVSPLGPYPLLESVGRIL